MDNNEEPVSKKANKRRRINISQTDTFLIVTFSLFIGIICYYGLNKNFDLDLARSENLNIMVDVQNADRENIKELTNVTADVVNILDKIVVIQTEIFRKLDSIETGSITFEDNQALVRLESNSKDLSQEISNLKNILAQTPQGAVNYAVLNNKVSEVEKKLVDYKTELTQENNNKIASLENNIDRVYDVIFATIIAIVIILVGLIINRAFSKGKQS